MPPESLVSLTIKVVQVIHLFCWRRNILIPRTSQRHTLKDLYVYASEMRVLGRIRLSKLTDESTSAARQRELIEQWSKMNDHTIVGWAEDLDVSGSVDPFDAPALGPWWDRESEWDILCAWKLDRVGRRAIPLNKVFGWMIDHDKTLVCVSDNIDLSTWVGRLIANVIAGVAEGELEAIRERNTASKRALREAGRWPGGRIPFGYAKHPLESGGYTLKQDPVKAALVRQLVEEVCAGAAVKAVAAAHHIPDSTLRKMLRTKSLLGHAVHKGQSVRDREGNPVVVGDPILSYDEWELLQSALEARSVDPIRTRDTAPMAGVVQCFGCGKNLHHHIYPRPYGKKMYRYYYCPTRQHGGMVEAETVEGILEETFLRVYGDDPVTERVYRPREDHQIAIAEAVEASDELSSLLGTLSSKTMTKRVTEQLSALDRKIAELEKLPAHEAGWELKETGPNFRSAWENGGLPERRQLLLNSGIRFAVRREPGTQYLETRITQKIPPG